MPTTEAKPKPAPKPPPTQTQGPDDLPILPPGTDHEPPRKYRLAVVAVLIALAALAVAGDAARPTRAAAVYPLHTGIVSTTFWSGERFSNASDGSQVCSTYSATWAFDYSGVNDGTLKKNAPDCAGSPYGGCDGVSNAAGTTCTTEKRTAANGYFPLHMTPKLNPFYLDLPVDDLNNAKMFKTRCQTIPWAKQIDPTGAHCSDPNYSYMLNRWVAITGPNGNTCYGQIADAGPGKYDDTAYVFGNADARPQSKQYNRAGMDVSPALNSCLGFKELDGDHDRVSWRFVDDAVVPPGPWLTIVSHEAVNNRQEDANAHN